MGRFFSTACHLALVGVSPASARLDGVGRSLAVPADKAPAVDGMATASGGVSSGNREHKATGDRHTLGHDSQHPGGRGDHHTPGVRGGHAGPGGAGVDRDWLHGASEEEVESWLHSKSAEGRDHPAISNNLGHPGHTGDHTKSGTNGDRGHHGHDKRLPGGLPMEYDWVEDASDEDIESWLQTESLAGQRHPAVRHRLQDKWNREGRVGPVPLPTLPPGFPHPEEYAWMTDASEEDIESWLQDERLQGRNHPAVSSWRDEHADDGNDPGRDGEHARPGNGDGSDRGGTGADNPVGDAGKETLGDASDAPTGRSALVSANALQNVAAAEETSGNGSANAGWLAGMFLAGGLAGFLAREARDKARRTTKRGEAKPAPARIFTDAPVFSDKRGASNAENDLEDAVGFLSAGGPPSPPARVFTDAHISTDKGGASNVENNLEDDMDTSLAVNTTEIV